MLDTALFYSFALLTLMGAILTVSLRNAVHCAHIHHRPGVHDGVIGKHVAHRCRISWTDSTLAPFTDTTYPA